LLAGACVHALRWSWPLALVAFLETSAGAAGTINVHVSVPGGRTLTQSSVIVLNPSLGVEKTAEFGGGFGPFVMTDLPQGPSYSLGITSQATTGEVCSGTTLGFFVVNNLTTIVAVNAADCVPGTPPPPQAVPALGRYVPLLGLALAVFGFVAARRRRRVSRPFS
jgi:hypothetical protein